MTPVKTTAGTLYLVPTPLDFGCDATGPLADVLPTQTVAVAARLSHWITENSKSTRAFLKRVQLTHPLVQPLQSLHMTELPRAIHKKGDHGPATETDPTPWLAPALAGHDIGLISEAGMPAIADPGSSVVRAAHALGLTVVPLVGPISLMLALAASGLNGQHFSFVGYLPQDASERLQRIRQLEAQSLQSGVTQLCIETPYRNEAMLTALVAALQPRTRLGVCCGVTLAQGRVFSAPVADWKRTPPALPLQLPTVFMWGR